LLLFIDFVFSGGANITKYDHNISDLSTSPSAALS